MYLAEIWPGDSQCYRAICVKRPDAQWGIGIAQGQENVGPSTFEGRLQIQTPMPATDCLTLRVMEGVLAVLLATDNIETAVLAASQAHGLIHHGTAINIWAKIERNAVEVTGYGYYFPEGNTFVLTEARRAAVFAQVFPKQQFVETMRKVMGGHVCRDIISKMSPLVPQWSSHITYMP